MPAYSRNGTEITLNTQGAAHQVSPAVAGFAGGGFVAVWTTYDAAQDGGGWAIKAQLFDADGAATGGEMLVNSATALDQRMPAVTTLASGNFLVTWETADTSQDGAGTAIKAQLFSGTGVAIGGEFRVNTQTAADQTNAVVTGLADGGFVVAWQTADATQDGRNNAIKGQRYDADGVAVGGEFLISPTGAGSEFTPDLTGLADGGFLATWTLGNGQSADIYAQLFDAAGAQAGAAFRVNGVTALNQDNVSATQLADGRIVMTWVSAASLTTNDRDIKAQAFSAGGVRIGEEFTVNTTRTDPDFGTLVGPAYPQIDDLPDGGFVITWTQWGLDSGIRGQFFDANAGRVGGEVVVNTAADRVELDGDVAVDGLGRLFAVWASGGTTGTFDNNIRGQFFTATPGVAIESNGGGDFAAISVVENTSAVTTVTASGGPGVVYAIVGGFDASRFTIDATSGTLAFVSPRNFEARNDSNGNNIYRVVVTATSGTQVDLQQLTVTVTNVNEAPSWTGSGATMISYHEDWTDPTVATVAAVDPDGDTLTYSLTGTDAGYFTISPAGVLAFAAPADYEAVVNAGGDHYLDVTVAATDGTFTISRALTIDLFDQNEGPVITAHGGGDTAALTMAENIEAVGYIGVIDPDWLDNVDIETVPADVIFDWIVSADYEFTLSGADAALFRIQNPTGYLYFLGGRDFEAPSDADGDGVYEVTVTVSDGYAPTDSQALSITVTPANDRPVITSNGGGSSVSITLAENLAAVTTVTATDPDGDGISYSIGGGADAALFTIDASTGALSFVAAPDREAPGDVNGDNVYHVIVAASDGALSGLQSLSVIVANVDEAVAITSEAAFTVAENGVDVGTVAASDPEGLAPVFALAGGADAALFAIDAGTGALTFVAAPDFEAPSDADGDNVYEVAVAASDGTLAVTRTLTVTVDDVAGLALDGTAHADTLAGGAEADTIRGFGGNDVVGGGAGDDLLQGNAGDDTMIGGAGDDTFYVEAAGDLVIEAADGGSDLVRASTDHVLANHVERLILAGGARAGTGNALDNTVFGAGAGDALAGLAGADALRGQGGRDVLDGGDGNDLLDGGVGRDTLIGGAGRDTFQFRDGDFGSTRPLADTIADFSQAEGEKIQLQLADADTTVADDQAFAWIGGDGFSGAAGQLRYAHQGGNTYVEGDTDGDGTANFAIMLAGTLALTAADFTL